MVNDVKWLWTAWEGQSGVVSGSAYMLHGFPSARLARVFYLVRLSH